MPRQQVDLVNGEVYHICYRAVGDSLLFKDQNDYYRGIFSLYELNNTIPVLISIRRRDRIVEKKREKLYDVGGHTLLEKDDRDLLVDILAFCFMPNHLHLLLRQTKDGGITKFMKKVGGGYAGYFNRKYRRKGHLFNQFKAIHVKDDNQLKNVITYIHCNPISLVQPKWKDEGISNPVKVVDFLDKEYRWSSLWDYNEKPNFASVTKRDFLLELLGAEEMRRNMNDWIQYKHEVNDAFNEYSNLFIE